MQTKKEMQKECRRILNETTNVVSKENSEFLMEKVFPNHFDWDEKKGVGVDHIKVRQAQYGTKCFYIVRTDGTETDISYMSCIYPHTKMNDIMAACRTSVSDIIENMRNSIRLPFTCPITGDVITKKTDINIDHYDLTFKELVELWVKDKDVDELYADVCKSKRDKSTETYFTNPILSMDFYDFHNKHTHLRAVSERANLSVLKRKNK